MNAVSEIPIAALPAQGVYLGPAKVGAVARGRVQLVFPDQQAWAALALAAPYQPATGDVVLAIAHDERWYVIGVLEGKGVTTFTAPGNLELRAPHGEIRLHAAKGVKIKSALVAIAAEKLDVAAESVTETFHQVRRSVAASYEIAAGSFKAVVAATLRLRARRIAQRAEKDVTINGQQVRLG